MTGWRDRFLLQFLIALGAVVAITGKLPVSNSDIDDLIDF